MIKGSELIGVAILVLVNTAAYAAGQPGEAKTGIVGKAAVPLYPQVNCSNYPLNITQSGSYLLGGNITLSCGADAIDVKADSVVIDLGGYTITGTSSSSGIVSGHGIGINGSAHSNITVKNGSVLKMGGGGIYLGAGATVEELTASYNGNNGILIEDGTVRHVHTNFNGREGIGAASGNAEVSDSEAISNAGGISLEQGGTVLRNVVANNTFDGIICPEQSVISNNVVRDNGARGILGVGQITNNSVAENGDTGIEEADAGGASIVGNTIVKNGLEGIFGMGASSYGNNQLYKNHEPPSFPSPSSQVFDAVQMGLNICDGVLCP